MQLCPPVKALPANVALSAIPSLTLYRNKLLIRKPRVFPLSAPRPSDLHRPSKSGFPSAARCCAGPAPCHAPLVPKPQQLWQGGGMNRHSLRQKLHELGMLELGMLARDRDTLRELPQGPRFLLPWEFGAMRGGEDAGSGATARPGELLTLRDSCFSWKN